MFRWFLAASLLLPSVYIRKNHQSLVQNLMDKIYLHQVNQTKFKTKIICYIKKPLFFTFNFIETTAVAAHKIYFCCLGESGVMVLWTCILSISRKVGYHDNNKKFSRWFGQWLKTSELAPLCLGLLSPRQWNVQSKLIKHRNQLSGWPLVSGDILTQLLCFLIFVIVKRLWFNDAYFSKCLHFTFK